jgi:hypothetical protein
MLELAAECLLALFLSFPWGLLLWRGLEKAFGPDDQPPSPELVLLLGLSVLAGMGTVLAFFGPIGSPQLIGLSLPALAWAAWMAWKKKLSPNLEAPFFRMPWLPVLVLFFFLVLANASKPAINGDSGLYHVPAISFLERQGLVKGLGNLHTRLAFHSQWFVASALFHLPRPGGTYVHGLNALLAMLLIISGLRGLEALFHARAGLAAWLRVLCLAPLLQLCQKLLGGPQILDFLSSPGPDFPVAGLCWFVLAEWLEQMESDRGRLAEARSASLAWLASFAVSLKLSALPLLALPVLMALSSGRLLLIWAALPPLLPFFLGEAVLSGWLLFPGPYGPVPGADWRVPEIYGRMLVVVARSWAKMPMAHFDTVDALGLGEWIWPWWSNRSFFERAELILAVFGWLPLALSRASRPAWMLWVLAAVGSLFWFLSAPDPRFGQGFLIPAAAAPFLPFLRAGGLKGGRNLALGLLLLFSLQSMKYLLNRSGREDWGERWLSPAPYPRSALARTRELGGLRIAEPVDNACWDRPELCSCERCSTQGLGSRPGGGFNAGGFDLSKMTEDPWFREPISGRWRKP